MDKNLMIEAEISTAEAGRLVQVSAERVRQLTKEGWVKRIGPNRYRIRDVVAGYLAFRDDEERQVTRSAADARVRDLRGRELDLRIRERERRHIAEAQAETLKIIDEFGGPLKSDLMALPARLTTDLSLRRKFEDQIDGAFNAAAKRAGKAADMVEVPRG